MAKLSESQITALRTLAENPGGTYWRHKAGQPGLRPQSLDALEKAGLIETFPGERGHTRVRISAAGLAALASAMGTETVYVVHTCEGNTFEAAMTAAQAQTRLAELLADPHVSDARIEGSATEEAAAPKLTAAQSASLALVAEGRVSYSPGRGHGASSNWTRYSYHARIGGKFARRTKSVDALVELELATLTGSASGACPVVLTEAGRKLMGVQATPITACRALRGARILLEDGTSALVSDYFAENGKHVFRLRLSGGLYVNHYVDPFDTVAVLS
jgi:hypothetical protein